MKENKLYSLIYRLYKYVNFTAWCWLTYNVVCIIKNRVANRRESNEGHTVADICWYPLLLSTESCRMSGNIARSNYSLHRGIVRILHGLYGRKQMIHVFWICSRGRLHESIQTHHRHHLHTNWFLFNKPNTLC